ncbi:MAG: DUF3087 family protein [Thalassotalea sp.]|nr:DUF3087 family protein [Thalassotalea sp.]
MKIIEIDKSTYRQRLNRVIIGFIITLTVLSIAFGSALIAIFSEQINEVIIAAGDNKPASNFKYNFLGVVFALLSCAAVLQYLKTTPFFYEIYYVWQLKQIHNLIYRKLKRIKTAAFDNVDKNAMIVLHYYYTSLYQVYVLDDNTLTISSLKQEHQKLNEFVLSKDMSIEIEQFDKKMITTF